jgi:hypothetical protein
MAWGGSLLPLAISPGNQGIPCLLNNKVRPSPKK